MLDIDDIADVIANAITAANAPLLARIDALEQRKAPEKGDAGKDGAPGAPGEKGEPGDPGKDGADGVGLSDAFKDEAGNLVLVMSDGRTKSLGCVNGKDGVSPAPFTLDDFDIEPIDERSICVKFTHGGECHAFELEFPVMIYRGVWTEQDYARGDVVTWGGSMWHADEATRSKPGTEGWTLAAKKGRDGRDAK